MANVGIIGSGIAGLQLGLGLQRHGIPSTIYSERTPEQELARRLPNMVARNGQTRARERQLEVNHWEAPERDMVRLSMRIRGMRQIAFSGCMSEPAQAVDMRIYCARLLEDFSARGGRVVIETLQSKQLDEVASRHDVLVVASGRASLSTIFPRVAEHSPFTTPQRLIVGGVFRGIAPSEPRALEVIVNPGSGEMIVVPMQSFEPDVTGIGILIAAGGAFESLRHIRHDADPRGFVEAVLGLLREHAPTVGDRIDSRTFDVTRPEDLAYAAITPTVRRGFIELSNGRYAVALGDAHVVIDPLTGQGANNASHGAAVLCEAIRTAHGFDRPFCERVEQEIASYVVPVSDACNSRLLPPKPHFRELLAAASEHQTVADLYGEGYSHPNRFWEIASSPERTAAFLSQFGHGTAT
jgi:2-polyprenyl-6-methoxyphenol hydroxylase-like FAD-dependent oxidoreductase